MPLQDWICKLVYLAEHSLKMYSCFAWALAITIETLLSYVSEPLSLPFPLQAERPLFFGPRALEKLRNRKTKPASYNLDLNLIGVQPGLFNPSGFWCHSCTSPASFLPLLQGF